MGKGPKPKFAEPFQGKKRLEMKKLKEQDKQRREREAQKEGKILPKKEEVKPKVDDTQTGNIKNKLIKYQKLSAVRAEKKERKKARKAFVEANPDKKQEPNTIEKMRRPDDTLVKEDDEEVIGEDNTDEFASHFSGETQPKILMTTCKQPHRNLFNFLKEFVHVIPNTSYYSRKDLPIKTISKQAAERGFTTLIVLQQKQRELHGMYVCSLPEGPTSYFRITSLKKGVDIEGGATCSKHLPELVLKNFDTRLGHRLERQMRSLFPINPEYTGRRVVAMHNQRDFIFFRHYRYAFKKEGERCQLQEIGPSFTMKLRWIMHGNFDFENGEFEYLWRPDMGVDRKKFYV